MQQTPRGLRLQIGLVGRRNSGKSSVLNALAGQQIAIVSDVPGTTTDPVEKAMELQPLGPVLFIDTAGIDEDSDLGRRRVEKTMRALDRIDVAMLVCDAWMEEDAELLRALTERGVPVIVVANKSDLRTDRGVEAAASEAGAAHVVRMSAATGEGLPALRRALIEAAPASVFDAPTILADLVSPGDLVLLVVPIDIEAPRGRLILPQVQTLRELLDADAMALVVKERELAGALQRLTRPPALVITDSQEFLKVAADTPLDVPLTSFSILFSRFKGDLAAAVDGAMAIDTLRPGDRILLAEGCTHHPTGEDIGRVKIPRWLEQYVGGRLEFSVFSGHDFPDDLAGYRLVIHCGACVLNRRHMLSRIERCREAGVPITNYGLAIACSLGIFDRALRPFPAVRERYLERRGQPRAGRLR